MPHRRFRVLLVDDDEDDFALTRYLLTEIKGTNFDLDWAPAYEKALEVIARCEYDVYLIDFRLGARSGVDLLRDAHERGCKGPFLMLTGQGQRELDVEAMHAGAADYLEKGQLTAALLERSIRYAIERFKHAEELEHRVAERTAELALANDRLREEARERGRAEEALRVSRERLDLVVQSTELGLWYCDLPFDKLIWSDKCKEHFGLPPEAEVTIDTFFERLHPDDRERTRQAISRSIDQDTPYDVVHRTVVPGGAERWVRAIGRSFRDTSGKPIRFDGVTVDVTAQKRIEADLAESHRFLRSVLDTLPSHIAVLDEDGTIVAVNEAWRRFAETNGLAMPSYAVGENYLAACEPTGGPHEPDVEESMAYCIREVITGARSNLRTEYACHSPADPRWFQMRVSRFPGEGPTRVVVAHEDITPRVQSELAVRRRSGQLQELARIAMSLNITEDVDKMLGQLTEAARQLIGARRAVITPGDQKAPPASAGVVSAPMVARGGKPLGLIQLSEKFEGAFTADDQAMVVQLAQMASAALENARLYQDLREVDRRKDEFLAMLAHELRNPLAPIRNALYLVRLQQPEGQTEAVREAYAMMDRQLEHLVRLVDDLLDVSRITSGKIVLRKEPADLATVVSRAVECARPLIDARGHRLDVLVPSVPMPMLADSVRLTQVVLNLLTNAAKYTPRGGRIWLSVERESSGDWAALRVRDTGIGIPPAMLARVFDLFTQVDRTIERTEGGLGIGLTLVKRLTELHGGTVEAASAGPGQGSEFLIRLPLSEVSSLLPLVPDGAASTPCRILVVDDNRDSANSLARLLRVIGHEVRTAHEGRHALHEIVAHQPQVVVLDLGMPGMTGYEVARHLREMSAIRQPLLVALTGFGTAEDRRMTREAGFDEHLVKPVDLKVLLGLLTKAPA